VDVYSLPPGGSDIHCLTLVDLEQLGKVVADEILVNKIVTLLAPGEKTIFDAFSYPKRRVEWLGGRIAAKAAAMILAGEKTDVDRFSLFAILPARNGSPELSCPAPADRRVSVSISHSEQFATAMAALASGCGVDIQKISDRTRKVLSRFAEPKEVSLLADKMPELDSRQQLTLLWSVKEAVKKTFLRNQPAIFQGVSLENVRIDRYAVLSLQCPCSGSAPREVEAVVLGEYTMAFTIQTVTHA